MRNYEILPVKRLHNIAYECVFRLGNIFVEFSVDDKGGWHENKFSYGRYDPKRMEIPERVYNRMSNQARGILFERRG